MYILLLLRLFDISDTLEAILELPLVFYLFYNAFSFR